ncbi:MAG: transcriptional regulator [Rhodospirillaceae bacterium]|nr:MAG: transcriptional regulator [Rhodospirillaceae bacterium]
MITSHEKSLGCAMDNMDLKILRVLQEDSSLSVTEVAQRVGLSTSPCWKRINKLQADGIILRHEAVLDAAKLGLGLTVFMMIKTGEHSGPWLEKFAKFVKAMPEVQEFHRMAGEVDYLLKIVVADMQQFDDFYKKMVEETTLTDVTSSFSMEIIKHTNALPI